MSSSLTDRATGLAVSAALKAPCRAASSTNLTLSGEQTVNGVALVADDRVLVNGQTNSYSNGVYIVSTGAWQRAPDTDSVSEIAAGTLVYVSGGTLAGLYYMSAAPATLDVNPMTFALLPLSAAAITGQVKAASGTALLPGYSWVVDLDSGFYWIGANNFGVSLGGSKVYEWTTTGPVATYSDNGAGVGPSLDMDRISTSPAVSDILGRVQFNGRNSIGTKTEYASVEAAILSPTSGAEYGQLGFYTVVNAVRTLIARFTQSYFAPNTDGATSLGVAVLGWGSFFLAALKKIDWGNGAVTITHAAGNLIFAGASTVGYTFDSQIDVTSSIGTTNPRIRAANMAATNLAFGVVASTSSGCKDASFVNSSASEVGSISQSNTATTFATSSDKNLKSNLREFDSGAIIDALAAYHFDWTYSPGDEGYGVLAQDAHEVFPAMVVPGSDNKQYGDEGYRIWAVDYSKLVPVLLKELQALRHRVEELEAA